MGYCKTKMMTVMNNSVDSLKNSILFEESKECLGSLHEWSGHFTELPLAVNWHHALIVVILVFFFYFFFRTLWLTVQHICKGGKSHSLRNSIFINLVLVCYCGGVLIYFYGYDYAGTSKNVVTLLLRSVLSSFEMFLSKSNLIGIAENCKANSVYMMLFAFTHTLAVVLSTFFAVACFWKRIRYFGKSIKWGQLTKNERIYVFWGLNERSYMLARDLFKKYNGEERIVFVDFPDNKNESNKSQSFSSLMGFLSFKSKIVRQLDGVNYVLFRSSSRPSEITDKNKDFFDELDLMKLKRILDNSTECHHFIFTDNESSNLRAAVNMLETDQFKENTKIYCAVRKTKLSRLIEEKYVGRLKIVDDSRMAVNSLKGGEVNFSYPIDYVSIDTERAIVESCFTALIIGFGTTGQDALRFLYEFSAFPNADGRKSPVKIHVVDNKINETRGSFLQEVPAMEELEGKEIELHHMDVGSKEFFELVKSIIKDINYVVIATGDDERNIEIASSLLEMANQYKDNSLQQFRVFVRLYNEENREKFESAIDVYKSFSLSLSYFGSTKSLYTEKIIIANSLQKEAEEFHKSYCEANKEEEYVPFKCRLECECQNAKVGPLYAYRSMERKESQNKANRMHVYTKIKLMGLTKNPNTVVLPKWEKEVGLDQCDIDKVWVTKLINTSICEHLRWNASHMMMGYVTMTDEVSKQTIGSCNLRKKQHRCIVAWNKLDKQTQSYDYYVVRTSVYLYLKGMAKVELK